MTTDEMRDAIKRAPYKQRGAAQVYAMDETGAMFSVADAITCDNGSIVFMLDIRYAKEVINRERIDAAIQLRDNPQQPLFKADETNRTERGIVTQNAHRLYGG